MMMRDVLGLILGGGRGTRLYPLTQKRSKPAVPLGGKYRLIDIPISNCINSGINKIAILTQYNSTSLHRHIFGTYRRDMFTEGWVEIFAAEQTPDSAKWYQGTADAVRQQLTEIRSTRTRYVLVLAGDHLYQMDYSKFVNFHEDTGADISLAVQPVNAHDATGFGILKLDDGQRITMFHEKPALHELGGLESVSDTDKPYMASMGIYVFATDMLMELLEAPGDDFGKEIVPAAIDERRVMGYIFDGYWADIGTVQRFYEVNLDLTLPDPPFDFNNPLAPIFTHPRFLPSARVEGGQMNQTLIADGCRIDNADITRSVIGLRSVIGSGTSIVETYIMGADYYESDEDRERNRLLARPDVGIGDGSTIEGALIDKNARIGRNVHIRGLPDRPDEDHENWFVRDGVVVVPKSGVIPDDTVI